MDWAKEEARWVQEVIALHLVMDEKTAAIPWGNFEKLNDYSCTMPSGEVFGKVWRRHEPYVGRGAWWLGQYQPGSRPNTIKTVWRELYIVTPEGDVERATDDLIDSLKAAKALAV